jgi:probable F420-dependent oxidoreductase
MKIGVTVPNHFGVDDPQKVVALGQMAEDLGYDSIWVMDHLFNLGYIRERLEDKPYYHPLGMLTFLAAKTSRVSLGTSVLVLPYHNPVEMAKYVATLDHLSGGRVILGIGAGGLPEEFDALGVPMKERGSLTNESIRLMKHLWTAPRTDYHSRRWDISDAPFSPKPLQQSHVPIWVGGTSTGAKRRAALLGDGWHPNAMSPDEFSQGCQEVREIAAAAGRDPASLTMSVRVGVYPEAGSSGRNRLTTDPAGLVPALTAFDKAGAEHVVLAFDSGDVDWLADAMTRVAKEVVPAFA